MQDYIAFYACLLFSGQWSLSLLNMSVGVLSLSEKDARRIRSERTSENRTSPFHELLLQ